METLRRVQRLFRIGVAVAGLMLLAAAALITVRESQYDRLRDEYAAAREAAALLEQFIDTGEIPELPSTVSGFGLYERNGVAIFATGSAPRVARPPGDEGELERNAERLRLVRPIGRGPSPMSGGRMAPEMTQRNLRRPTSFVSQFVLVDYDLRARSGGYAWERAALVASGVLTAAVLLIVVLLYRRLQGVSQQAEEQRRLARLGEAARTLAHEIRNPLTAAQMQTALLRRTTGESQRGRIDALDEELGRIRRLTDQIREFLKAGDGRPETLAVLTVVREIADRLAIETEVRGDESATVSFDRDRFGSVVGNLLQNAHEADETGDPIRVEARVRRGRVRLSFADGGPGVPEAERLRVFDPFFTTKTRGSGVGLAVTRRFVEEAGGRISIHDGDNGGAVFVLDLKGSESENTDRRR